MDSLDNILDEYIVKPEFAKICVEGLEKEVLEGRCESILNNIHINLILKYNRHILRKKGGPYSSVINMLVKYGFEIHEMIDDEKSDAKFRFHKKSSSDHDMMHCQGRVGR